MTNQIPDDQNQWYTIEINQMLYTLPTRYQDVHYVGQGAFGAVIRATDTVTGQLVAIKKLLQPFRSVVNAQRTYREIKLLMYLNHADANVVQLYNIFSPERTLEKFQNLYLVFNYVPFDLHKVIKRNLPFSEDQIQLIIYSLLRGLKFIHSAGVIHRDIKPMNIGVDNDLNVTQGSSEHLRGDLRRGIYSGAIIQMATFRTPIAIFDFGLARTASEGVQTGYVATRWWRAPEVMVSWERYDEKLDIWSVGCVMGELIRLTAIFPGVDHIDQLKKIIAIVGAPDADTLGAVCEPRARDFIMEMGESPRADFNELFGYRNDPVTQERRSGVSVQGVDFLSRLLTFDSRVRPTVEEALAHPFLSRYRDAGSEPTLPPLVDEHQDASYDKATWKAMIWDLIQNFTAAPWASRVVAGGH